MYKQATMIAALLMCGGLVIGATPYQEQTREPDNTKVNKRDRKESELTADQQGGSKTDRELARKIRRAIVQDESLSTYGHNVKVIVRNGRVTLKGPVHSEQEKSAIEAKAAEVAGASNITNQLAVKGDTADRKKNRE
jgi:hyperosmotically inducible protein